MADDDAQAAAELIDSLEDWFCQGAVTSRVGDFLTAVAASRAFAGFSEATEAPDTDESVAHERMAKFQEYGELVDYLLDHFVKQLVDGDSAREQVMQDIAATVVALVDDEAKAHFTCVPFIAGALDLAHFNRLIADTQNMMGPSVESTTTE